MQGHQWKGRKAHVRFRFGRRGQLTVALASLLLIALGAVRLADYEKARLDAEQTAEALRTVYHSAAEETPTASLSPVSAAVTASASTPAPAVTALPTATIAPTFPPWIQLASQTYADNPQLQISARFDALRQQNGDIVGWLSIYKMLDEAVTQRDNVFYLDHDSLGNSNVNGALFLDSSIDLKLRPYTYILYGHNMKSGAMFGSLRNYESAAFYRNDPFLTFNTLYESGRYVIFAVSTVSIIQGVRNFLDFYALRSVNMQERQTAINALIAASVHECPVDVQVEDQLLVLVTCVDQPEARRVIAARRIREGEREAELKALVGESN